MGRTAPNFSTPGAQRAIIVTGAVTGACVLGREILPKDMGGKESLPSSRMLVGMGIMYLGISGVAEFAPSVAAALAIAVMVTAIRLYGVDLLTKFTQQEKK